MKMLLMDEHGSTINLCWLDTVDEARALWSSFAGMAGSCLVEFQVWDDNGLDLKYTGSYGTDEC